MNSLGDLISQGYTYAQQIVAVCAFFMVLYAGLSYMMNNGKDFMTGQPAWKILRDVVIGLILLFSAYVILNTVNHSFVNQSGSPALPLPGQSTSQSTSSAPGSGVLLPASTATPTPFFSTPAPGSGVLLNP